MYAHASICYPFNLTLLVKHAIFYHMEVETDVGSWTFLPVKRDEECAQQSECSDTTVQKKTFGKLYIRRSLHLKEKHYISDATWHELAMLSETNLPPIHLI